jgi:hypothetical protein
MYVVCIYVYVGISSDCHFFLDSEKPPFWCGVIDFLLSCTIHTTPYAAAAQRSHGVEPRTTLNYLLGTIGNLSRGSSWHGACAAMVVAVAESTFIEVDDHIYS